MNVNKKRILAATVLFTNLAFNNLVFAKEQEGLESFSLDKMIVTASAFDAKLDVDTPATTEIFTQEDFKNYNGTNAQEILEYATGAISAQPTGVGSTFGMRGLTGASRNPTILIDGIAMDTQGFANLDAIPVNAIERIEIIRGSGGVIYGSDSLTGVINIVLRKTKSASITAGAGSRGKRILSFNVNNEKMGIFFNHDRIATRNWYTSSKTSKGGWMEKNSGMLYLNPNENFSIKYLGTFNENDYDKFKKELTNGKNETQIDYHIFNITYKNKGLDMNVFSRQRKYNNEYYNKSGVLDPNSTLRRKSRSYGFNLKYNWQADKWHFTTGTEIAQDADTHGNVKGERKNFDLITRNRVAIYFLAEQQINKNTALTLGGRQVMYENNANEFCPSLQVLHKLNDKESIFLNIDKSFRIPALGDQYSDDEAIVFNDKLKPETGYNYEIGWKKALSNKEMLKLSLYKLDIKNRIYTMKIDDDHSMVTNANRFKNTGVELAYEGWLNNNLKLKSSIAFSNPVQNTRPDGEFNLCDDKLLINSVLTYQNGKVVYNLLHQYAAMRGNAFASGASGIKQYLSLNLTYNFNDNESVKFGINNVLNRTEEMAASRGTLLPYRDWFLSYTKTF